MAKERSHTEIKRRARRQQGFFLVEVLTALAVFLMFSLAISEVIFGAGKKIEHARNVEQAVMLAREALEASRNLRDSDFANLAVGTHGLAEQNGRWVFEGNADNFGIFSRAIEISEDGANRKKIAAAVAWNDRAQGNNRVVLETHLTDWRRFTPSAGLTIDKIVINHGGNKVAADFAPFMAGTTTLVLGQAAALAPGTYQISETADSNYAAAFGGDCDQTGLVSIDAGAAKVCQITNEEKTGRITIDKNVVGGTKVAADFAPYKIGNFTGALGAATAVPAGTYQISETADPFYVAAFGGDCDGNGLIAIGHGETKTCVITNTFAPTVAATYSVTADKNNTKYVINGANNPTLALQRGKRYIFNINAPGQPFWIKIGAAAKTIGTANAYNNGVQNNGVAAGQIIFDVPPTAPAGDLYYISQNRAPMTGNINTTP